jgi:hypothetical protein
MGVRLRAAIADDLPDLVDVEASATTRYYEAGFDPSLVQPRSELDLGELLADTVVYVAEDEADDSVAGYVCPPGNGSKPSSAPRSPLAWTQPCGS